ncbi:hypothetical protein DOY81_004246 [Sarcophaga bullata]|nr:hypothetical protein DOY81_004246 [Sarcophaga bullata]
MLGKQKQERIAAGNVNGESTNDNQIFNSTENSMNHIDLEADIDLNL